MSRRFVQKNEKKKIFLFSSLFTLDPFLHTRRNAEQNDLVDGESVIIYVDAREITAIFFVIVST